MRESEIADVIEAYARSAACAVEAGFDGIALHGAHGYMIDAFLWSGCNRREDGWGGNLHRRGRFAVEVVRAVRQRSEEHTSELQSLMRISYAVFCLKKKKRKYTT